MTRDQVYALVDAERSRQLVKWGRPHPWGWGDCSSPHVTDLTKMAVLTEEVGEVARALLDGHDDGMRDELVQVAAVAVAWLESLEAADGPSPQA